MEKIKDLVRLLQEIHGKSDPSKAFMQTQAISTALTNHIIDAKQWGDGEVPRGWRGDREVHGRSGSGTQGDEEYDDVDGTSATAVEESAMRFIFTGWFFEQAKKI